MNPYAMELNMQSLKIFLGAMTFFVTIAGHTDPVAIGQVLNSGKTIQLIFKDADLVSRINNNVNTRNYVSVQGGKIISGNDGTKTWCDLASRNGFLQATSYSVEQSGYLEKVYLGTTRANMKVSSFLFLQCNKGGFDQSSMTLNDLRNVFGNLVEVKLSQ